VRGFLPRCHTSVRRGATGKNLGRKIYADASQSVLLLYAQSSASELIGQGSGFVIEGQRIVTNAHVANAGDVVVDFGAARLNRE